VNILACRHFVAQFLFFFYPGLTTWAIIRSGRWPFDFVLTQEVCWLLSLTPKLKVEFEARIRFLCGDVFVNLCAIAQTEAHSIVK